MNARDRPPRHRLRPAGDTRHRPAVDRALCADVCGVGEAMRPVRLPTRPSKRSIRNALEFMSGGTAIEQAPAVRKKTGKQKESLVNDAVYEWGNYRGGRLYRNRRGMVRLPGGGMFPYGLGPNGAGDMIGYIPVRITASMVGKTMPIYTELESKTATGRLEEHQIKRIEMLRDDSVICGCVRSPEDCEELFARWLTKVVADER